MILRWHFGVFVASKVVHIYFTAFPSIDLLKRVQKMTLGALCCVRPALRVSHRLEPSFARLFHTILGLANYPSTTAQMG